MRNFKIIGLLLFITLLFGFLASAEEVVLKDTSSENIWNGTWTGTNFTIYIEQDNSGITGEYEPMDPQLIDPGMLEGNVSEDRKTYSGVWIESGSALQTLSDDNMSFTINGSVNPYGTLSDPLYFLSNATRIGEISDPENPWTGNWTTERKLYVFTQDGTSVSGSNQPLSGINDESATLEGTLSDDRRIYTGNWTETGIFSFVISDDGSTFNATIHESLDPSSNADIITFTKNL